MTDGQTSIGYCWPKAERSKTGPRHPMSVGQPGPIHTASHKEEALTDVWMIQDRLEPRPKFRPKFRPNIRLKSRFQLVVVAVSSGTPKSSQPQLVRPSSCILPSS